MADLFWLTRAQLARVAPFVPLSRGVARVDGRRVVSGIVHIVRNGLRWRDAPAAYGPHRRSTTAPCAGAGWACSTISLPAWRARGIEPCIPSSRSKVADPYDRAPYRERHRVEVMFGRLTAWRRVAMR